MAKLNKKKGLGRGLDALIPQIIHMNDVEEKISDNVVELININSIYPNKNQPRKDFEKEALLELAESIKKHGIIQPVIALKKDDGYMIIAGERRWRAAREAKLTEIPCIVKNYDEKKLIEVALIENIQREDLNIIEEALAYKYIIDKYEIKQDQLAEALGKSRPHVANTMRLLQLYGPVLDMIREGRISAGQGRALLAIKDESKQYELSLKIEQEQLNVRQVELLVKSLVSPEEAKKEKVKKEKDFLTKDIENSLKQILGTKVNIVKGNKRGKIEIEYYSEEEFERILEVLQSSH
ncbi:ParB/RepB/Spo0J family partition protein [Serpentinicella alkaliphila]|uniref:ParB family chromosome partitioning protein n=1 Tax=Serpentinicella alkaliphila TaxID=1734049 RepID=A0A4R2U3J6_9FIRM|nr:ParB/RepB/Spo0J family partition protein [Serpentinicella alkaliphila]QUH25154.1 ParB/RepB/Spo0J family partition protein [Serpentinicella alkaliphila]TCQ02243.1 ParB family chromosome partitioning protein [Serpentinicella alkaliphila]